MLATSCWTLLALAGVSMGAPTPAAQNAAIQPRASVPHDSLSPITTRVQAGSKGAAIEKFNPKLHIASGCEVYTAVDDAGNVSGGLQPSGSTRGGCRDVAKGQTYARIGSVNGMTAIMYAWYFPKDQLIDGVSVGAHRHDWEAAIIYVDDIEAATPKVIGGSASGHGDFKKTAGALPGGDTAQIEYFAVAPTNHELQFTGTVGNQLPVSDWDALPAAARDALQTADFGKANVPFKDGTFESNIAKAVPV